MSKHYLLRCTDIFVYIFYGPSLKVGERQTQDKEEADEGEGDDGLRTIAGVTEALTPTHHQNNILEPLAPHVFTRLDLLYARIPRAAI